MQKNYLKGYLYFFCKIIDCATNALTWKGDEPHFSASYKIKLLLFIWILLFIGFFFTSRSIIHIKNIFLIIIIKKNK